MFELLIGSVWGWIGTTALVVLIALAVAWFIPPLRPYALLAIGAALAIGTFAARVAAAAAARKQKEWDDAIERDVEKGEQARRDAERDVARGGVRGDEWDRDKGRL